MEEYADNYIIWCSAEQHERSVCDDNAREREWCYKELAQMSSFGGGWK